LGRRGIKNPAEVNMSSVIREYLSSPEHANLMASHPKVEIRSELEQSLPAIVGSHVHLSKSVMNLVTNAVEAIPSAGGSVTIATRFVVLEAPLRGSVEVPPGRYVSMVVTDTGIGIPAQDLQHIFEPFYSRKKLGRSGSGLGLTVIWGTVTDHNGYVTVESAEHAGTTFSLYFPISEQAQRTQNEEPTVDQLYGNGERILLVDDIEEQRTMGFEILQQLGYEGKLAASGEEAISCVREREYDLVILDMIMEPGIDGVETFLSIRQLRPRQRAIIMSGYSETSRVREAMNLGVAAFLQKPYSLTEFGRVIRQALQHRIEPGMNGEGSF
jgi:CheY-like chemotaxis protein